MSDWVNLFPDPIMANALMDRLCHNAHQIIIKGESHRKKKIQKMKTLNLSHRIMAEEVILLFFLSLFNDFGWGILLTPAGEYHDP